MSAGPASARARGPAWREAALVVLVCLAVYWPRLGTGGFTATEGHRVVPAWGMLASGDWLIPRMFGQVYLRKPPGVFWAIAGSTALFGESEWAARAASAAAAIMLALIAYLFASRWFGRPWGLVAGLAQALMPLMWSPGRSAEIEALNTLAIVAACLLLIDLAIPPPGRSRASAAAFAGCAACAIAAAALFKGPVVLPFIGAAIAGACLVQRSARPLLRPAMWFAVLTPGALVGVLAWLSARAVRETGEPVLAQGVGDFLWGSRPLTAELIAEVLVFVPAVLLSGLPASLALLFVPVRGDTAAPRDVRLARAAALACVLSLGVMALLGVSNPRYGMPAAALTPVLAGFAARRIASGDRAGWRAGVARALRLNRPALWAGALLAGAALWIFVLEPRERARSGREAGIALAAVLPDGAEVYADHLIAARPEVLVYARREAARQGREVLVRWTPVPPHEPARPRRGGFLVLRTDEMSGEDEAFRRAGVLEGAERVMDGEVHKYTFAVYRFEADAQR